MQYFDPLRNKNKKKARGRKRKNLCISKTYKISFEFISFFSSIPPNLLEYTASYPISECNDQDESWCFLDSLL